MATETIVPPRPTERFSKTVGGSIKSLIGEKGRKYFILEHKTLSNKHRAGETREFVGDYVELGRGNKYAINFGDDCPTVSRPHAAISRNNGGWVLKHLSKSNPTIVNRDLVNNEVPLKNGDEIQLSYEGPKMLFLTPNNNLVSTMGFTTRMKAVVNEAVKPYRTAFGITISMFVLIIAGLIFYTNKQSNDLDKTKAMLEESRMATRHEIDSLKAAHKKNDAFLLKQIQLAKKQNAGNSYSNVVGFKPDSISAPLNIKHAYPDVYYVQTEKIVCEIDGSPVSTDNYSISGTGFLLSDGRFVTARHVVKPWLFLTSESTKQEFAMNLVESNKGKVIHYFTAISPSGKRISFRSDEFNMNGANDVAKTIKNDDGKEYLITLASINLNGNDWASASTNITGGLAFSAKISNSLDVSSTLYFLGYPFGMGANSASDIAPIYSESKVSRQGLDNGLIDISDRNFDHGNSGGPVFVKADDRYYVVGIVSASRGQQGFIVPISAIR